MNFNHLLRLIQDYERKRCFDDGIRRYDCWEKELAKIAERVGDHKIIRRIGFDLILGKYADLLRVSSPFEFDSRNTDFLLLYEDERNDTSWYIKVKEV